MSKKVDKMIINSVPKETILLLDFEKSSSPGIKLLI